MDNTRKATLELQNAPLISAQIPADIAFLIITEVQIAAHLPLSNLAQQGRSPLYHYLKSIFQAHIEEHCPKANDFINQGWTAIANLERDRAKVKEK